MTRALGGHLAARERDRHVDLAEQVAVRCLGVHGHHDLGLLVGLAEVDAHRLAAAAADRDRGLRVVQLVAHARVRLAEDGPQLGSAASSWITRPMLS